jgi:hypothetical protein
LIDDEGHGPLNVPPQISVTFYEWILQSRGDP